MVFVAFGLAYASIPTLFGCLSVWEVLRWGCDTRWIRATPASLWTARRPRRRRRYPRHYHLRIRIARRSPLLVGYISGLVPWDPREFQSHLKHKWLSNPRATYGSYFDVFCASLDPGLCEFRSSAWDLGDFGEQLRRRKTPRKGHRPMSRYQSSCPKWADEDAAVPEDFSWWLSRRLDNFCKGFDPRLPIKLMNGSFLDDKLDFDLTMRTFGGSSPCIQHPAQSVFVAASVLQGEYYDTDLRKAIYWGEPPDENKVIPIVIDTGASISISGEESDFVYGITAVDPNERIQGLNHSIAVAGIGTVRWKIRDELGQIATVETTAYYIPEARIRLFSPQLYFLEEQGGSLHMNKDGVHLTTADGETKLSFPINPDNNLPLALSMPLESGFCAFNMTAGDIHFNAMDETNQNLTGPAKELLGWHQKFGHCGFSWVQSLMIPRNPRYQVHEDEDGLLRKVVATKHQSTRTCDAPMCCACKLARPGRRPDGVTRVAIRAHEMAVKNGDLLPGDCVSLDQYESSYLGRLPHTKGKERKKDKFVGGTIGVDHASGMIFVEHQASLRTGNTLESKKKFEKWARQTAGIKIRKYHADNLIFNSAEFMEHINSMDQLIDFSGVGAHHQNGVAERNIRTVTEWARTMMLHAVLHWPDEVDLDLWPFALDHAVYLWNHLPNERTGVAPVEFFTGTLLEDFDFLKNVQPFGCPCYVLQPKLQDGKKLPKWVPRTRRGQYLGVSTQHASTIGRIRNLVTGHVSPQFHVVYDPWFTTVPNAGDPELEGIDRIDLEALLNVPGVFREQNYPEDLDELGNLEPPPALDEEWLTFRELETRRGRGNRGIHPPVRVRPAPAPDPPVVPVVPDPPVAPVAPDPPLAL